MKRVEILYNISINRRVTMTSLWLPLPIDTYYQKLLFINYEGEYSELSRESRDNTPMLYVMWKGGEIKRIKVKIKAEIKERVSPWGEIKENGDIPQDIKIFLMPTQRIPTDGIVKKYADGITQGKVGTVEKARAIYDWIVENTYRDPKVNACGLGDVKSILESRNFCGKCVDIGSIFVALSRSTDIPAREIFGIRVDESKLSSSLGKIGNITNAQHCKAEFYVAGYGWMPVDPADVKKVILEENLSLRDEKIKKIREYLFGNWEDNWLAFNYARDITLNPPQNKAPLNYFMYPYCEIDGNPLSYLEPEIFSYEISSLISSKGNVTGKI